MSTHDENPLRVPDRRSVRILARTLARDLTADGFDPGQLIALASELIDEATARLRAARDERM